MGVNQSDRQAAVRAITGTALDYNGDFNALFTNDGVTAVGDFDGRFLAWLNIRLSASYTSLPAAMAAYATANGFNRWDDINTISATGTPAFAILASDSSPLLASDSSYIVTAS